MTGSDSLRPGPLTGVRVLDFTSVLAGPYCTRLLADMGAEVIKVEAPEGDHKRGVQPLRDGHSTPFAQVGCGKQSIVLDLKSEAGWRAAFELGLKSDVIVENWRPGVADRLKLGYQAFKAAKPEIIYCAISGYGQTGPKAQRPAFAPILHADSGFDLAVKRYQPDMERPIPTGILFGDVGAGLAAFGAISAALHRQKVAGEGQFIDVAMFDVMLSMLVYEYHEAVVGPAPRRIFPPLRASDGFVVVAPVTGRNFEKLALALDRPDWLEGHAYSTPRGRLENWVELMADIEAWTSSRSAQFCEETLQAADVPCSRYRTLAENLKQDYLRERGTLSPVVDGAGELLIPSAPFLMPGADAFPRPHVPELGEDTQKVLTSILGYDAKQIEECRPVTSGGSHKN